MAALGSYIKARRELLNSRFGDYSIRAVARRIGIHQSYLSKLERGEHAPLSESTLIALARDLGEDQDLICALGGRIPSRVAGLLSRFPERFVDFVRELERESGTVQRNDSLSARTTQRNADLEELVRRLRKEVLERHRLERNLALEEQQLRLILNNLHGVIVLLLDWELNVVWASDSLIQEFELQGPVLGKKCYRTSCGSEVPCADCSAVRALRIGTIQYDLRYSRDGERCWRITNIPLRDPDGKVCRVLRFGFDIKEIERSRKAVDDSEKRWNFALEGSQLGVWDWDVATGHEYHSRLWKTMLGYDAEEPIERKIDWEKLIHPEDYPETMRIVDEHLHSITPCYERVHRLRCKGGGYKWIRSRGLVVARSPEGRPLRVIGTHEDISVQKHLEALAEENHSILTAVFNAIPIGISVINPDMTVRFVNEYLRSSVSDVKNPVGGVCYSTFSDQRGICADCPVKKAYASCRKETGVVHVRRGGIEKWVRIMALPIMESRSGKPKCVVEIIKDVTREHDLGLLDFGSIL